MRFINDSTPLNPLAVIVTSVSYGTGPEKSCGARRDRSPRFVPARV